MDMNQRRLDALMRQIAEMSKTAAYDPVLDYRLQKLKASMSDPLHKVVVAGHFSSGKSTFLNALMGAKVLISRSGETTSCATRVFPVPPDHELAYSLRVHYRDGHVESGKIGGGNSVLLDATTLHGTQGRAADIKLVDIFHPLPVEAERICFVDTPGGNGMTPHLFDATREEIQSASAIVFMMSDRGITAYDGELIQYIRKYQERVFFVVNQVDRVEPDERKELLDAVAGNLQSIFGLEQAPQVWGLSSSQALEARLSGDAKLLSDSGFASFERQLTDYFSTSALVGDYIGSLEKTAAEIGEELAELQAEAAAKLQQQQELDDLNVKRKLLLLRGKFRKLEHEARNYIEADTTQLLDSLDAKMTEWVAATYQPFSSQLLARTEKLSVELRSMYKEYGSDISILFEQIETRINRYDTETHEHFGQAFASFARMIDRDLAEMAQAIPKRNQELIGLLLRFQLDASGNGQPFGKLIESLQTHSFSFKPIALREFHKEFTQLRQLQGSIVKLETESTDLFSAVPVIERQLESKNNRMNAIPAEQKRDIEREGRMPDVERWTEEVEVARKSYSGFGLRDALFGKKTETRNRSDDSARRRWQAKLEDIEKRYKEELVRLNDEAMELSGRIDSTKRMAVQFKRQADEVRRQVDEKFLQDIVPGLQRSYRQHANLINAQAGKYLEQTAFYAVSECGNELQQDRAAVTTMVSTEIRWKQEEEERRLMGAGSTRMVKEESRP